MTTLREIKEGWCDAICEVNIYVQGYEERFLKYLIQRKVRGIQRSSLACIQHFESTSLPPVLRLSSPPADIADADKENGDMQSPPSGKGVIQQIWVPEKCVDTTAATSHKPAGSNCLWCFVICFVCCKYIYPQFHGRRKTRGAGINGIAVWISCSAGVMGNSRS